MCFTIGCDPELVVRKNGQFACADNFFKANSSMGLDGCSSIAEIRPGYSESPIDLTAKIHKILDYGHSKQPELEFISGHYANDFALGGHIHISISPEPKIISALDIVLRSLSNCIDDRNQRSKRERTGYGKLSSYRKKYYGMEYRTPGSWLLSPSTTLVTLTLAKIAVIGVTEDNLDFVELKERQHSRTFILNLKHLLHTIPEDCREGLKELDVLLTRKLDWNQNILPNWGIAI
jgi:Phage phiEco32-like COOH.NH2 ligase-type 2